MRCSTLVAALTLSAVSSAALAEPLVLYPVQTGAEIARFRQGVPTLDLDTPSGAVQITPLPFDHGHVTFGLGIYNKSGMPTNFGIENVSASVADEDVPVLGVNELEKRAKSRAMWSQIGIAVLTTGVAAAAATAYTTNRSYGHMNTPIGSYSWQTSYRDNTIGVLGATAATAGGVAAISGVQNRLDYTLANLARGIVQTTTLEPDASYGGRIVLEKPKGQVKLPYDVHVMIAWIGARYPFVFRVTRQGVDIPPAYTIAARPIEAPAVPALRPLVLPAQPGVLDGKPGQAAVVALLTPSQPEPAQAPLAASAPPMSEAAIERAAYLQGHAQGLAQLAAMGARP